MKLKNVLIVVKDIERSRQFYHDLFGFELVLNNDGNMILTEGLVLQEKNTGESSLEEISFRRIIPANSILRNLILRVLSKGLKSIIRK